MDREYWYENFRLSLKGLGTLRSVIALIAAAVGTVGLWVIREPARSEAVMTVVVQLTASILLFWFAILLLVVTPAKMWREAKPRPLEIAVSLGSFSVQSQWVPESVPVIKERPPTDWWLACFLNLQITNKSSTENLNLLIKYILPAQDAPPTSEIVLDEHAYEFFRQIGEWGDEAMPNPLHLEPQSTRKRDLFFPVTNPDDIEVFSGGLWGRGSLLIRDLVSEYEEQISLESLRSS